MNVRDIAEQLDRVDRHDPRVALSQDGRVLASIVQIQVEGALKNIGKYIREATVRRDVVVRLIQMLKDDGHRDYQHLHMDEVEERARRLTERANQQQPGGMESVIPVGIEHFFDDDVDRVEDLETDKAATPAERARDPERVFIDRRPNCLVLQRDSDAQKCMDASRAAALEKHASINLQTSSTLLPQFESDYLQRVFPFTLPRLSAGPDFHGRQRFRRKSDAPKVELGAFTAAMARQAPAQIRWDWTFLPALQSLHFTSQVNTSAGLGFLRRQVSGGHEHDVGREVHQAAVKLVKLLHEGEYVKPDGSRGQINGDTRMLPHAVGLTDRQRQIIRQYTFITESLAGTRQVRQRIGHLINSACIVYGLPVFGTLTPSERHSGLALRLTRYRRNDPALQPDVNPEATSMVDYIGMCTPSLEAPGEEALEEAIVDIPDYDLRKLLLAKDPLCAVDAFAVQVLVVLASLLGMRMCPDCPDCAECENPCIAFSEARPSLWEG